MYVCERERRGEKIEGGSALYVTETRQGCMCV